MWIQHLYLSKLVFAGSRELAVLGSTAVLA